MSDNEILSDEELAVAKALSTIDVGAFELTPRQLRGLIARLERAEQMLKHCNSTNQDLRQQLKEMPAEYIELRKELTAKLQTSLNQALKCLAEAPSCGEHDTVDALDYWYWYHSPARQNLLKGPKP